MLDAQRTVAQGSADSACFAPEPFWPVRIVVRDENRLGQDTNVAARRGVSRPCNLPLANRVYVGNHAVHLPVPYTQLNGIPRRFLSTLPYRDTSESYLTSSVPNPFSGLATTQNTSTSTPAHRSLPRIPGGRQFLGMERKRRCSGAERQHRQFVLPESQRAPQKLLSNGFFVTSNYILSKLEERASWLNDSDPRPEKRISLFNHSQRFVVAATYALPVGHAQRFDPHSRWVHYVIGDWQLNNFYTWQSDARFT
jgi:hypothetical protein